MKSPAITEFFNLTRVTAKKSEKYPPVAYVSIKNINAIFGEKAKLYFNKSNICPFRQECYHLKNITGGEPQSEYEYDGKIIVI